MSFDPQPPVDPMQDPMQQAQAMQPELPPDLMVPDEGEDTTGLFPQRLDESAVNYNVNLSEQDRMKLGVRVCEEVAVWFANISDRIENAEDWRRDVECAPSDAPLPWPGAAEVRAPFTAIACHAHETKLNGLMWSANPMFGAKARKREALAAAPIVEDVLNAKLEEANIEGVGREVHKGLPIDGLCLVRVRWETEYQRVRVIQTEVDDEAATALTASGVSMPEAMAGSVKTNAKGEAILTLGYEDRKVKDGPELGYVPFYRMVLLPSTANRFQDLYGLGEVIRIRGFDLKEGAKRGRFIESEVDLLLKDYSDEKDASGDDEYEQNAGLEDGTGQQVNPLYREYECYHLCWQDTFAADGEGDGTPEWFVVTVHKKSERVLQVQYLPYEHGRPYYVPFSYLLRDGQLVPMSIAELGAGFQAAATDAFCSIIDLTSILKGAASSFMYDYRSGIKPGGYQFKPGTPWSVKSVEGIRDMPVGRDIPAAIQMLMQLLELIKGWFDLLTAANNTALGKESSGDKTAYEVGLMFGQSNAIFEDYARNVALAWSNVADQVRWLTAQYSDRGEVEYRVEAGADQLLPDPQTGQPARQVWQTPRDPQTQLLGVPEQAPVEGPIAFGNVPAYFLRADIDLMPSGLGQFPDRQSRLQRDLMIMDLAFKHPVIGQMQDVLVELFNVVTESAQMPQREKLLRMIQSNQQQMAQMQAMAQAMELEQAATSGAIEEINAEQGGQKSAQDAEAHKVGMQERQQGLQRGAMDMAGMQSPAPKGKK